MAIGSPTLTSAAETPTMVAAWVAEVAALTQPEQIYWCEGSAAEAARLRAEMSRRGELLELHRERFPGCFLYRSAPTDVARVEHLTYICTASQE
jgi:phosphoenolpyruvate carboxykinase (GTP)